MRRASVAIVALSLGIWRGDGVQTTRRIYQNNLDTGLVSDIPSESRLRRSNRGL